MNAEEELSEYEFEEIDPANGEVSNIGHVTSPRLAICGVYFLECQGFIKIGRARDILRRTQMNQIGNPFALQPLGYVPQPSPDEADMHERFLHDRFSDIRHRGEWFIATDKLRAYILAKATPWPTK